MDKLSVCTEHRIHTKEALAPNGTAAFTEGRGEPAMLRTDTYGGLPVLTRYPDGFDQRRSYPAILFLHGAGSRSTDMALLKANPFFSLVQTHKSFPFVVFAPQCARQSWFDVFEQLIAFSRHPARRGVRGRMQAVPGGHQHGRVRRLAAGPSPSRSCSRPL